MKILVTGAGRRVSFHTFKEYISQELQILFEKTMRGLLDYWRQRMGKGGRS